jgi:hypothetical protein
MWLENELHQIQTRDVHACNQPTLEEVRNEGGTSDPIIEKNNNHNDSSKVN